MSERSRRVIEGTAIIGAAFLSGAVPFAQIAARLTRGVDLREHGSGTVSGTGLHEVAGFGPLAMAGVLEVAKGAIGPALAGAQRPLLRAATAGATVAGHNWSPFLGGAGGRGISPATGALLAGAPVGAAVLLGGMTAGRLAGETAIGSIVADALVIPAVRAVHGETAEWTAIAVVVPMIVKRLMGNRRPEPGSGASVYFNRLLLDRDEVAA